MRNYDTYYQSLGDYPGGLDRRLELLEIPTDRPLKSDGSEAPPLPSGASVATESAPPPAPVVLPPVITRESLGEAFLAEVRRSTGEEAPIVWDRFFAKVKLMCPGAYLQQRVLGPCC